MLVWEMAKVFGEECNSKDWILHYEVSKIDRFMFVAIYQRNIPIPIEYGFTKNIFLLFLSEK